MALSAAASALYHAAQTPSRHPQYDNHMAMSPAERTMRSRAAAYAQWAAEPDWTARTAPARAGLAARFERLALDKHPGISGAELAKYAEVERRLHMANMTLKSARRRKRAGTPKATDDG